VGNAIISLEVSTFRNFRRHCALLDAIQPRSLAVARNLAREILQRQDFPKKTSRSPLLVPTNSRRLAGSRRFPSARIDVPPSAPLPPPRWPSGTPEPARAFHRSGLRKNRLRGSGGGYPIASRDRLRTAYTDRWDYLILNLAGMASARIIAIVERTSVAW